MFKIRQYFILLISLLSPLPGNSCINEYKVLLSGKVIYTDAGNAAPRGRFNIDNKSYLYEQLDKAEKAYRLSGSIEDHSDYGAMLVYTGQYAKAKAIFLEIEMKSPGRYATASNLGTTYELSGNNDSARFWIKRGMDIDAGSHGGSEWIHLKILEGKMRAKGDEKYLWTHSILDLDFGKHAKPENNSNEDPERLRRHLSYQLSERMSFVKPRDPVVAQLLFDLGNVAAITQDASSGLQIYQAAKEYGYSSELFDKRYAYFTNLQLKADFRNKTMGFAKKSPALALIILALACLAFIISIVLAYRWVRKKSMNNSGPGSLRKC